MKTNRKYFPLALALLLAALACTARCFLTFLYTDDYGEYSGSKTLLYSLVFLLIAALTFAIFLVRKSTKGYAAVASSSVSFPSVFTYACTGFFQVFSLLFMTYALIGGSTFFEGETKLSSLLLILASAVTAALCFIKATGKEEGLRRSPFYSLLYIFPVAWSLIRLFVLFLNYSAMAIYTTEKLRILSLIMLTVYFLFEARLYYYEKPVSLTAFASVSLLTVVLVPLSALPSFLKSLFISEGVSIGEPILCLVELAMCAFAAATLAGTLKNRRKLNEN